MAPTAVAAVAGLISNHESLSRGLAVSSLPQKTKNVKKHRSQGPRAEASMGGGPR